MLIEQVLPILKAGKKISRKVFGDVYIYRVIEKECEYYIDEKDKLYTGLIAVKDGEEYHYAIDGESLFADDWYIV